MKKWLNLFFIGFISIFIITSCASKEESSLNEESISNDSNKLKIVTTIFPAYDFAREITGDNADVSMLLPPGLESHSYEPSPQDIINIQDADLFIYTGGESDTWVKKILDSSDHKIEVIRMMDLVDLYEEELVEGMQGEDKHDNELEHEYDEHVWTSLRNAQKIVNGINDKVSNLDLNNKTEYEKNTKAYIEKLNLLDEKFKELFNQLENDTLIFGDRFPFRYFAEDYDLKYYAAFPGCSSETEPSIATITFLIDKIKEEKIGTIFYIEFSNHKIADTIAEATGARTELLHSCHNVDIVNLNKEEVTYYSLMEQNYNTLKGALK
ncbi:MAG: metal ABC transporter substrate-binding protein [Proteocatella sp.]